jgi:hypothetical protein
VHGAPPNICHSLFCFRVVLLQRKGLFVFLPLQFQHGCNPEATEVVKTELLPASTPR